MGICGLDVGMPGSLLMAATRPGDSGEGLLQLVAEQQQQKQKQLSTRHFAGHTSHARP